MRLLRLILVAGAAFLFVACGPHTIAELSLDLDSFLPDGSTGATVTIPATTGVQVFLLPGLQIDEIGGPPDADMSRGALVSPAFWISQSL